jgi:alpha-D-xyloside xylohydrolase
MFGSSILVNPVVEPKALFRMVYLPEGSNWYNFWTGKKYSGGQTLSVPTPIDEIPLYIKAGSIIPMGPFIQYATESADSLEIRIYPGVNGRFTLYEDEGDNYNYEKGAYSTIDFYWDDKNKQLSIEDRKGQFSNMLQSRTFNIILVEEDRGIGINYDQSPQKTIYYEGEQIRVLLD